MIDRMSRSVEQVVDEILVMDCQSGRVKALEMLVSRWQKRLWRYAYHLTGDSEAAWDVTQDSWLGIIRGISRLNDPARFRPWAYRIVTNKANDWIRKGKRSVQANAELVGHNGTLAEKERQETAGDLHSILRLLPAQCRTVLSLYYLEEFGLSEVANILRIPEGTVKSRLHRARSQFKELWQQHFDELKEKKNER
jgi:RNA polymerase sigma-70 factor (ECF subfamily)